MKTAALILLLALGASAQVNRPVSKVVEMLKDMQTQLENEGSEDEEVYEKMTCWCETNDKDKTKAIADAEGHLADLTASIEELTASAARLTTEVSNLGKEIAANGQALATATSLRQKELAEFVAEEKDSVQSIAGLKQAIVALSKHNAAAGSLVVEKAVLKNVAAMVGPGMGKYQKILAGVISPSQKRKVQAFVQNQKAFLQNSYAPQGGEIWGILTNMKESFEANLATAQKNEADAVAAYQELKAAKEAEIASGTEQKDAKTVEMSTADEKCARDREDHEDTTATLGADEEYLAMLKETCKNMDSQMAERVATRANELEAVSKAIAILTDDDSRETMVRTLSMIQKKSSFTSSTAQAQRREKAASVLEKAATKLNLPKLAALAISAKLSPFKQVKAILDKMITDLEHEKQDEIDHRDWCIEEFSNVEKATELKSKDKDALDAKVADLTEEISQLTKAIDALNAEIAEMQVQVKKAGEDRELENKEFQQTVQDQRATQKILTEAVTVLKGFYDKSAKGVALVQKQEPAGPPPPPGFKSYDDSKGRGPIAMIEGIIAEAKTLEAEAIRGEEEAQKAYEDMVKKTNAAMDEATADITNKSAAKGKAEGDKAEAEIELEATVSELELLSNKNNDIHSSCDFLTKNFDIRQSRRDDEMEALRQAIGILSGAK